MSIYDDARMIASELFEEFKQGTILYVSTAVTAGATPDEPSGSVVVTTAINATARPVSTKYVDGTDIVQSDKEVSMPNDGTATPTMTGSIRIDGETYKIKEIMARPAAGDPVSWTLIVGR